MSTMVNVLRRMAVVAVILVSISVTFYLGSSFEPLSAVDTDKIRIIGLGTLLLLSTVATAFVAIKFAPRV